MPVLFFVQDFVCFFPFFLYWFRILFVILLILFFYGFFIFQIICFIFRVKVEVDPTDLLIRGDEGVIAYDWAGVESDTD